MQDKVAAESNPVEGAKLRCFRHGEHSLILPFSAGGLC